MPHAALTLLRAVHLPSGFGQSAVRTFRSTLGDKLGGQVGGLDLRLDFAGASGLPVIGTFTLRCSVP